MGIRETVTQVLSAPSQVVLQSIIGELVEEALSTHPFVSNRELDALRSEITSLRHEVQTRLADLAALEQAAAAHNLVNDEDALDAVPDLEGQLERMHDHRDALERRLERTAGALRATSSQVEALSARIGGLSARADQAMQVATTAQSTAESAADGVSALEDQSN